MALFKNLFSKKQETPTQPIQEAPTQPKGVVKSQRHKLENLEAHMEDIMGLVEKNENYKLSKKAIIDEGLENEKIYEFEILGNTTCSIGGGGGEIQVFVSNTYIGDIKKGSRTKVKKLLESGNIKSITAEISGGNYKIVRYDSGRDEYFYDKLEDAFGITIEITYREEIAKEN